MKLTESQQAAIDHRGSNVLVSASAGSGKTEVLARRCVALIADTHRPCAVERLLVVTFTRAAAAELRVRLARMLREQADKTRDPALRDHLRRQEVLVGAADIGTIDAWCGRIVCSHSAEAGVDGEFTVLGEEDARLLRGQALDELFGWVYTAEDALADAARDWLRRHSRPGDDFLRGLISALSGFREHLVEVERWFVQQRAVHAQPADALQADAARVLAAALAEECALQGAQLAPILSNPANAELVPCLEPVQTALTEWTARLARGGGENLRAVAAEIDGLSLRKPRGLTGSAAALFDEIRTRWLQGRLQEHWSSADVENMLTTAPAAAALVGTLLDLEQRYQDQLTAAKRARAAYEFGDVLRLALDLLGTPADTGPRRPTEIAQRLRQRYEHILVDEYQDTSPVQAEILRLVTRDEPGCSNRFMVGDVKQSIYGFRQAEPRLFSDLIAAFEQGRQEGCVRYLADNFRSHPSLLAGLNRIFAMLLHPSLGGTAFDEQERLRAGREEIANPTLTGRPRIELHVFEAGRDEPARAEDETDAAPLERLEREAHLAARMICDMFAQNVQVPERDKSDKVVLRPIRLSDIVILLRSARHNAATVAAVLRTAGIPSLTSGRDVLFDVPEVVDLRNVLALLANRRQDVALAAYLRSPLVGLSAAEMQQIRTISPNTDFYAAVAGYCGGSDEAVAEDLSTTSAPSPGTDAALVAKVRSALGQVDRWSVAARDEELPELLRRILHETGLPLFAAGLPGGQHRVALLRTIENFAAEFARQGQHGVAEFVAYLEDLAAAELEPGLPVAAGEEAVRIMTVHAAKGLEFPVVFLLNAGGRFNLRRANEPLQCDETGGLGLRFYDYPARTEVASARRQVLGYRTAQRDVEEELRLLYVATTRARERLLIFGHAPTGAWEQACEQYAGSAAPPPLPSRLSVRNMLEWTMMAVSAARLHEGAGGAAALVHVITHAIGEIKAAGAGRDQPALVAPLAEWNTDDDAWLRRAHAALAAPVDTSLSELPAVLSVSAIKELARRQRGEDVARAMEDRPGALAVPSFIAAAETDGRDLGLACHRFLEHADLQHLDTEAAVRDQIDSLTTIGRLSVAEAALIPVADIAWFGTTPAGRLVAAHAPTARRELPFVYALPLGRDGEATIVRGIIDCLLETDAGLMILDYKTDRVPDEPALQQRITGYSVQLQLYAQAAGQILGRPVCQALLVFLHARRVVEVPCVPVQLDALQVTASTG